MSWDHALKTFCDLYFKSDLDCNWMIVGSVSSILQGAEMTPNDVDIYVADFNDLVQLSYMLEPYGLRTKSRYSYNDSNWLSSTEETYFTQTFPSGFTWSKGKWKINNFNVEIVQISNSAGIPDSDSGDGIWEGGKYIWSLAKHIDFYHYNIQIVPLEIQLESNVRRNRQDRVDAIIHALHKNGYDRSLLSKALSNKNKERFKDFCQEMRNNYANIGAITGDCFGGNDVHNWFNRLRTGPRRKGN